jgi:hypothetical protein
MSLHETAQDRVGDSLRIHVVFAATDLLLELTETHGGLPFPYGLYLP